jgi:ERCC4-type nuclease
MVVDALAQAVALLIGLLVAIGWLVEAVDDWRTPDEETIEYVDHLYATGQIDEREMERRKAVLLDPAADEIRTTVERVSGIGEATSWDIAARFDTIDDVREADTEELQQVANVGPQRARTLTEEL